MNYAEHFEFTDECLGGPDDYKAEVPPALTDSTTLLKTLYEVLQLPGYFGFNWNALADCLRDFHWLRQQKIIIRHADVPPLPPAELSNYLDVLAEAAASWKPGESHSLQVIFPAGARKQLQHVTASSGQQTE